VSLPAISYGTILRTLQCLERAKAQNGQLGKYIARVRIFDSSLHINVSREISRTVAKTCAKPAHEINFVYATPNSMLSRIRVW